MTAGWGWLVVLATALGVDGHLIRRGQPTLSTFARTHPAVTVAVLAYFALHFLGSHRLAPFDPLGRLARRAERWLT